MNTSVMPELLVYERCLPSMLQEHDGEFVVIKGEKPAHFSRTYEDALTWAYEAFGLDQFFVKRVAPQGSVVHHTRDIGPCR
jgi:hypothetical protein